MYGSFAAIIFIKITTEMGMEMQTKRVGME